MTVTVRRGGVWREPLLHFLVVGALLFVAFDYLGQDEAVSDNTIRVDREGLLEYLRHRDPRLNDTSAATVLESMTATERDSIVAQYVREEVLFRQAQALGLEQYDYAGRRRLISQLDYINRGFLEEQLQFADEELVNFYEANLARYEESPTVTFTHVFVSSERHGGQAKELATGTLVVLNEDAVPFHLGATRGDRFLYHKNYVDKSAQEIASHFGAEFAESVFALPASDAWVGPVASNYGYHVLMISQQKPAIVLPFDTVRGQVARNLSAQRVQEELDAYYELARAHYDVVVDLLDTPP